MRITVLDVYDHCPHFLEAVDQVPFRLGSLETITRWLYRICLHLEHGDLPDAHAQAEDLAESAQELSAILRETTPVLVAANFAADSPIRKLSRQPSRPLLEARR